MFHGFDDLLRIALAVEHVGIGHARHRQRCIGFAARIAGNRHFHQARVKRVLDIALQDAVFDQGRALGRISLVVDVERAAAVRQRAVVDHGDALGGHALAELSGKRGRALAVEIAFQPVADGFVQQHAGPAGSEHDRHRTRRSRARIEVEQGRAYRFIDVAGEQFVTEIVIVVTSAAAAAADFTPAILLGDDGHRHAHQRPDIGGQDAVAAGHQHHIVFTGQTRHHLRDARVAAARHLFDALQQVDLGGGVQRIQGIPRQIEIATERAFQGARHLDALSSAARFGDCLGGRRRLHDGFGRQVVRIRKRGALAGHGTHADALVDAETARFDDAFFETPGFAAGGLEVQVGVVDPMRENVAQHPRQERLVEPVRGQEKVLGGCQIADARFYKIHARFFESNAGCSWVMARVNTHNLHQSAFSGRCRCKLQGGVAL